MEETKQNTKIQKILFLIVMEEESSNLLEEHNFELDREFSEKHSTFLESYSLKTNEDEPTILLVRPKRDPLHKTSSFGTETAFLLTYLAVQYYNPCLIVNLGYAGYTLSDQGVNLGDVVIAKEKSVFHRRQMIIEFYRRTNEGHYPVIAADALAKEMGFRQLSVGTSNNFVKKDDVALEKDIAVVEMELCSVARACYLFNKPCLGMKIISDVPPKDNDESSRENEFLESLVFLKGKFKETFWNLVNYIKKRSLDEI